MFGCLTAVGGGQKWVGRDDGCKVQSDLLLCQGPLDIFWTSERLTRAVNDQVLVLKPTELLIKPVHILQEISDGPII